MSTSPNGRFLSYQYVSDGGDLFNITLSEAVAAAGGFSIGDPDSDNWGDRTGRNKVRGVYGVTEDGGSRFIKNEEVRTEFEQTNAFSELFIELATDEDAAAAFMRGIIPSGLDKVEVASKPSGVVESTPTKVELEGLSREDLLERLRKMDEV